MDLKEKLKTLWSHLCIYTLVSMDGGGIVLVDNSENERERERERKDMFQCIQLLTKIFDGR